MYIIKNALRCISRSKGRNLLIGIIVLVIAISACIGLSIRQAAQNAKQTTMESMSVTATISFDRQSMMNNFDPQSGGGFDREQFSESIGNAQSLTLEEYQKYAAAPSVKDFYYTVTVSLNGSENFEAVTTDTGTESNAQNPPSGFGGPGGGSFGGRPSGGFMGGRDFNNGDFSLIGYSSESAMASFTSGTASITSGAVFTEGTENLDCIISNELAIYNDIAVGDTVVISNPNDEEETYSLTVVGIYTDTSSNEGFQAMRETDPANKIYMSYTALNSMVMASQSTATTSTDSTTGREYTTALMGNISATYLFSDTDSYYAFEEEARALGLEDSYSVSSTDITEFENSLVPLNTLSKMSGWFLLVILAIGAVILIVLNIFNIRERKYEIGVLTAVGMKKGNVALQFLVEIFAVTLAAVIIGIAVGGVSAVPVTNALLSNQVAAADEQSFKIEESFGRGEGFMPNGGNMQPPSGDFDTIGDIFGEQTAQYISEINSAMNLTVVGQMLLIAILLTLVSGAVSMLFIMRYEPLKILSNRD